MSVKRALLFVFLLSVVLFGGRWLALHAVVVLTNVAVFVGILVLAVSGLCGWLGCMAVRRRRHGWALSMQQEVLEGQR